MTAAARRTQRQRIKAALLAREPVDPVQAVHRGWGLRLAALVHRIRRLDGWPVITEQDHRNGLARYRLPEGWTPATTGNPTPSKASVP